MSVSGRMNWIDRKPNAAAPPTVAQMRGTHTYSPTDAARASTTAIFGTNSGGKP
jgi:hypothetical protein